MTIIPFEITNDGTLEKYYYDRKTVDLSPYINIKRITRNAFKYCKSMEELVLPDRDLIIEDGAFTECVNLERIHCSSKLKSIEGNPFNNTKWLKTELSQKGYVRINGILLNLNTKDFTSFEKYPNLMDIERINASVFNSDQSISTLSFKGMKNLKIIEPYSFYHCSSLKSIDLEDCENISEIQNQTFAFCSNLTNVILPKSITNIHAHAFRETPWFNTLIHDISGIKMAVYDDMLIKFIDIYAQDANNNLIKVLLSSWNHQNQESINLNVLFPDIKTICSRAFEFSSITEIILPDKLQYIKDYAFNSCTNLSKVIFPQGLKNIDNNAFSNCFKLDIDITTLPINTQISETSFNKEFYEI